MARCNKGRPALCTTPALSALLTYQSTLSKACGKLGCPLNRCLSDVLLFLPGSSKGSQSVGVPWGFPQNCPVSSWLRLWITREDSVGSIWKLLAGSSRVSRRPTEARALDSNHIPLAQSLSYQNKYKRHQKLHTALLFL